MNIQKKHILKHLVLVHFQILLKYILKIMQILILHVHVQELVLYGINLIIINGLKIKQQIKYICL